MSRTAVEQVIGKMVIDREFRQAIADLLVAGGVPGTIAPAPPSACHPPRGTARS